MVAENYVRNSKREQRELRRINYAITSIWDVGTYRIVKQLMSLYIYAQTCQSIRCSLCKIWIWMKMKSQSKMLEL